MLLLQTIYAIILGGVHAKRAACFVQNIHKFAETIIIIHVQRVIVEFRFYDRQTELSLVTTIQRKGQTSFIT